MQAIAVYETGGDRQTSSFLKTLIGGASKLLIGLDIFKAAIKNGEGTAREAIAQAKAMTPESLDAKLRLWGIDPEAYYASIDRAIPTDADGMNADDVNRVLGQAQAEAKDPNQMMWLIGGLVLLLMIGGGASSSRVRRSVGGAFRRGRRSFGRFRARFRGRRGRRR